MWITKEQKTADIVVELHAGSKAAEIAAFSNLLEGKYDSVSKKAGKATSVEEGFEYILLAGRTHEQIEAAVRIPKLLEQLQNKIEKSYEKSMKFLARVLNVHAMTVRNSLHENIRHRFYAFKNHRVMKEDKIKMRSGRTARPL